jgi:hypothetical protein
MSATKKLLQHNKNKREKNLSAILHAYFYRGKIEKKLENHRVN